MVLEKLIALGARRFWVCGTCGSLRDDLLPGTLVVPSGALSEEGVSGHYPLTEKARIFPEEARVLCKALESRGLPYESGRIWTTDAPYRETAAKVKAYREKGVVGVDMEFSALLTVAAFRRVSLAAVMVVSDILDLEKGWQSGFTAPLFKQRVKVVRQALFNYL